MNPLKGRSRSPGHFWQKLNRPLGAPTDSRSPRPTSTTKPTLRPHLSMHRRPWLVSDTPPACERRDAAHAGEAFIGYLEEASGRHRPAFCAPGCRHHEQSPIETADQPATAGSYIRPVSLNDRDPIRTPRRASPASVLEWVMASQISMDRNLP